WSRDLGRSLIELIRLGRGENVSACIDWVFKLIKRWETDETLLFEGKYRLPRHVHRMVQIPSVVVGNGCFENDGHALFSLAVWTYWKRCEGRKEWASKRWEDIKALGDWFIWQFEHPEISRATDLLWSDSEASGWPVKTGESFYVDYLAMEALHALSEIAVEQGDMDSAAKWTARTGLMKKAIEKHYIDEDGCWRCTCESPAWKGQTNLVHIISACDRGSMDIKKSIPEWYETDIRTGKRNCENHDFHKNAFGYSNGFTIQNALLIDEMGYATKFLRECAMMIYHPAISPYLIPEDAMRIREHVYARTGDLGNAVQQAEMLKALRIIIGIDDNGDELVITPRLPEGWDEVIVEDYPVLIGGKIKKLDYSYNKKNGKVDMRVR
ncbi:MAG TPA: hypothetical protein PLZ84_06710, partial [Clostridia bacterium]|nr:hypothetical protein [Clostridia bacterium]